MAELAGARALVTGAAGFLGARLVRALLARGARVDAVVRASTPLDRLAGLDGPFALHRADIRDREAVLDLVPRLAPDLVFHLAMAKGHPRTPAEVVQALEASIGGTANLLEASSDLPLRRFVHFGSSLECAVLDRPIREDDPLRPVTPRGVAKAAAARLCAAVARERGFPAVVLRVFSVYGPGEPEHRLVPTALRCARTGAPMRLTAPGFRRDLVHVDDVCGAAIAAALRPLPPGAAVNVGSGRQHTNEEVVALVEKVTGSRVPIAPGAYPASPCDSPSRVADTSRARELLAWTPRPLEEGLVETIAWREVALAAG